MSSQVRRGTFEELIQDDWPAGTPVAPQRPSVCVILTIPERKTFWQHHAPQRLEALRAFEVMTRPHHLEGRSLDAVIVDRPDVDQHLLRTIRPAVADRAGWVFIVEQRLELQQGAVVEVLLHGDPTVYRGTCVRPRKMWISLQRYPHPNFVADENNIRRWWPAGPTVVPLLLRTECERESDGRWVAEVPAILGARSHGDGPEKAVEAARALAVELLADEHLRLYRWTVTDYERAAAAGAFGDERVELVDGMVYRKHIEPA